jgi:signal transduction histidine kinase
MTCSERLAILVHELRSPVAALGALAEQSYVLPANGFTRVAELAAAAGHDIERLLSDPDLFSLRPEEIELGSLLASLVQPGVTFSAEPVTFACDPTRMRQALGNLVANGCRHGTSVTVTGYRRHGRIIVEVRDDGPGIAAGSDLFERGVSGVGSSGYGLWIARAIAKAHGGELTAESHSGAGATFSLSVPSSPVGRG